MTQEERQQVLDYLVETDHFIVFMTDDMMDLYIGATYKTLGFKLYVIKGLLRQMGDDIGTEILYWTMRLFGK